MQDILGQITLVNLLSVMLLIASVWLLIIIVKKKTGYMFRGMVFFLFVLLALIYFLCRIDQMQELQIRLYVG